MKKEKSPRFRAKALVLPCILFALAAACSEDERSELPAPTEPDQTEAAPGAPQTRTTPAPSFPRWSGDWVWPERFYEVERRRDFTADAVVALIQEKSADGQYRFRTLDALLATNLFARTGPVRGRTMYMGHSRGLFPNTPDGPVSPETPRVMSAVGLAVMTAQNDPADQNSFNKAEMIATDIVTARGDFYLFDLAATDPAQRVQKNPTRCNGCHDRRFVWGMYPLWPGFIHIDDEMTLARNWGNTDTIGFSISLWEINMARIARQLLDEPGYYPVEKQVIAALLDCPVELFPFHADPAFRAERDQMRRDYYRDVRDLIDDVIETNEVEIEYTVDADGVLSYGTVINEHDPLRLSVLKRLLASTPIDLHSWSISRRPRESSWLMQTSGGLSLNRVAFYLIHNSPNAYELRTLVPNSEALTYDAHPRPAAAVCAALTQP